MTGTTHYIGVLLVLAVASAALADHDISIPYDAPEGTAVIDGELDEWVGATWIMLDETYSGTVTDLTEAKYALRWSSTTNLVYCAVSVIDTQLNLSDWYDGWNTQDDVEIHIDAGENDTDYTGLNDYAQKITIGTDGVNPDWGIHPGANPWTTDICPEIAAEVNGNTLTYEASFRPWSYYAGLGGTALPQAEVTLAADLLIGFDVVVLSRADDSTYGMLANNDEASKFRMSQRFQTWKLVTGGGLQADFDGDGDVDLDDFVILKNNFGGAGPAGDADLDGDVDLDDFVILKQEFGS